MFYVPAFGFVGCILFFSHRRNPKNNLMLAYLTEETPKINPMLIYVSIWLYNYIYIYIYFCELVDLPRWTWTISPPRSPAKPGWTALPGHMLNGHGSNGFGASMANGRWSGNLVKPGETWMMDGWNVESENHSGRNVWYIMCYHVLYVPLIFHVSIDGPSPVFFFNMERYSMHGMSRVQTLLTHWNPEEMNF